VSNPDCGWLEYFADDPPAGFFADAIEDIEDNDFKGLPDVRYIKK